MNDNTQSPSFLKPLADLLQRRGDVLFWGLVLIIVLLLALSITAVARIQHWMSAPSNQDMLFTTQNLHIIVTDSLTSPGAGTMEVIHQKTSDEMSPAGAWSSFERELVVDELFPLSGWQNSLQASLEEEGAELFTVEEGNRPVFQVRYQSAISTFSPLVVETLRLRIRPVPELPAEWMPETAPRVAIVIDDLGLGLAPLRKLIDLGFRLTVSILPHQERSAKVALAAAKADLEVLVHMPMEPLDYPEKNPGQGALLAKMSDDELLENLRDNISDVPGAVGVNNHMGSQLTQDARAMKVVMGELRRRKLFFLDSKTTAASVAYDTAREALLPAAKRNIFLDAEDGQEFVRGQVKKLLALAKRRGYAIGIGHPYRNTLSVLAEMRDEIVATGVEFVSVSELVHPQPPHLAVRLQRDQTEEK